MMTEQPWSDATDIQTVDTNENHPQWQPLESVQRRVLGVLIEKAKTTPDSYPLTLNSIVTASNQKSNRKPQMQLDSEDVGQALDELREMGAASEIQGDGRVAKYRHLAYQWLGVEKVELAVIAELLLRGQQTVGELRSRAARMEPIEGLAELRPVLSSLKQKRLLIELTPEGRGQIVTHGLYPDGQQPAPEAFETAESSRTASATTSRETASREEMSVNVIRNEIEEIKRLVESLTTRMDALEQQISTRR